jgi:hypothetical protein
VPDVPEAICLENASRSRISNSDQTIIAKCLISISNNCTYSESFQGIKGFFQPVDIAGNGLDGQ